MKFIIKKDKKTRLEFLSRERKIFYIKSLLKCQTLSIGLRCKLNQEVLKLNKQNGFLTRIQNRCYLTGRAGSVYKDFHLSRMKLRELALSGALAGVKKSSW